MENQLEDPRGLLHSFDTRFMRSFRCLSMQVQMGHNLGDAAVGAGVERLVFSGGERIGVDAMDYKAHIEVSWHTDT